MMGTSYGRDSIYWLTETLIDNEWDIYMAAKVVIGADDHTLNKTFKVAYAKGIVAAIRKSWR